MDATVYEQNYHCRCSVYRAFLGQMRSHLLLLDTAFSPQEPAQGLCFHGSIRASWGPSGSWGCC